MADAEKALMPEAFCPDCKGTGRADPEMVTCPWCDGTGTDPHSIICPWCHGDGYIMEVCELCEGDGCG